jgi:protein-disulfide isomerase
MRSIQLGIALSLLTVVHGGSPAPALIEGNANSPARVVIYEDLQCPDCATFQIMMDRQILPKYGDRVGFVHRDFPLVRHKWARRAAIASRFFAEKEPDLAFAYRRQVMASLTQINEDNFNHHLMLFARQHGLKADESLIALKDPHYEALVQKDCHEGVLRGVTHTPTVFVDGKRFVERCTFEEISKAIDEALAKAKY